MASAPATSDTAGVPAAMAEAARLTSHWGVLPPIVVVSRATSAPRPSRRASSVAGAGPTRVMTSTTVSRSMRSRSAGAPARAASHDRTIRSTGVTSASRSSTWPQADDDRGALGVGDGSGHGGCPGGSGPTVRGPLGAASYHRLPVAAPAGGAPDERGCGRAVQAGVQRSWGAPPAHRTPTRTAVRRLLLRRGHRRVPDRGRVQRPRTAGQQLAGVGADRPGGALGRRRRLLAPPRGGARPGRRAGLRQLPVRGRVGPGPARAGRGGPRPPSTATRPSRRPAPTGG